MSVIDDLSTEVREFAAVRGWLKFHTSKNLAMAIAGEAGELVAEFQWLSPSETSSDQLGENQLTAIRLEMADVLIYLLRLGDVLQIDLESAVREKLVINEERYPILTDPQ
jgi:dCTP diphosphatase